MPFFSSPLTHSCSRGIGIGLERSAVATANSKYRPTATVVKGSFGDWRTKNGTAEQREASERRDETTESVRRAEERTSRRQAASSSRSRLISVVPNLLCKAIPWLKMRNRQIGQRRRTGEFSKKLIARAHSTCDDSVCEQAKARPGVRPGSPSLSRSQSQARRPTCASQAPLLLLFLFFKPPLPLSELLELELDHRSPRRLQ